LQIPTVSYKNESSQYSKTSSGKQGNFEDIDEQNESLSVISENEDEQAFKGVKQNGPTTGDIMTPRQRIKDRMQNKVYLEGRDNQMIETETESMPRMSNTNTHGTNERAAIYQQ